jgi:hypothetical protein
VENEQGNSTSVKFGIPDPQTHIVIVSRVLPDGTSEPIGRIYSDFSSEDSVKYISLSNNGEEVFPPSSDFGAIEASFEKYAKQHDEKSLKEELESRIEEFERREKILEDLRFGKIGLETYLTKR